MSENPVDSVDTSDLPVDEPVVVEPVVEPDEDTALDQRIEHEAIAIPDGEKLVPLSALTTLREKYKATRDRASRADALDAELAQLKAKATEDQPWTDAAKTMAAQQQMTPQQAPPQTLAEMPPEVLRELTDTAVDLDLYQADGKPDLHKAARILHRQHAVAQQAAHAAVGPIQQREVKNQSDYMLNRALVTKGTGGQQPDAKILAQLWKQVDPKLTSTEEGAREVWIAAMGRTAAMGVAASVEPVKAVVKTPRPILSERSGGRDEASRSPMDERERKALKDLGMSEKEYMEADTRPWRRK